MSPSAGDLAILSNYVQQEQAWPKQVLHDFTAIWQKTSCKRRVLLTLPPDQEQKLYFVLEGVQRIYSLDAQQREATLVLTYPHSFAGVIDSFWLQTPSQCYFETLSPSVLLTTDLPTLVRLEEEHPYVATFLRKATMMALSGLLKRMAELQTLTSKEKIEKLLARSPHILKWVPHKYLANYLGIEATNFSRLLQQIRW